MSLGLGLLPILGPRRRRARKKDNWEDFVFCKDVKPPGFPKKITGRIGSAWRLVMHVTCLSILTIP